MADKLVYPGSCCCSLESEDPVPLRCDPSQLGADGERHIGVCDNLRSPKRPADSPIRGASRLLTDDERQRRVPAQTPFLMQDRDRRTERHLQALAGRVAV